MQQSPTLFSSGGASTSPDAPLPVGDPEALRRALGETLGFTPDQLHHHRRGQLSRERSQERVFCIEGVLRIGWTHVAGGRSARTLCHWAIGAHTFTVPREWFGAAPPGVRYRGYIAEGSQALVSLEPVLPSRTTPPVARPADVAAVVGGRLQP